MECATFFVLTDGEIKGWPMLACPFRALVVLYRMLPNEWATVSKTVHLPVMFPLTDFLFEKRIALVSMDLLYILFT